MQITLGGARLVASLATVLLVTVTPWTIDGADAQSLPTRWKVADFGGPPSPGGATFVSPTFTVRSRGFDVNGTADQFTFAYRSISGDVTIVARLRTLPDVDPWAQAGLMIRDGLSSSSSHASVFGTPGNGVIMRSRSSKGNSTAQTSGGGGAAPVWLKLERRSSTFTASRSTDGSSWTTIRSVDVSMSAAVLVGLAAASHSPMLDLTATLESVTVNGTGWLASPNIPPVIALTSPVNGSSYASPASVALGATATDVDGTIAKVDFYAGATLVGTDTTSPYALNWTGVGAGTYALKAVATDDSGATTTSALVNISVAAANVAPTVSLTTPANGATFTAPATIAIAATASDSDGTVAKVDFYAGATLVGTDTTSPFAYTWSGAAAGSYALKAVATDNRGATTTSAPVNITVSAPNVAPTVSLTTPANGATFTAPATIAIAATAIDSDGTVAKVDFYAGATLVGTDTTSPFAYTWSGAAAGTYAVKAVATDNRGASTTSGTVNVTVTAAVSGLVGAWVGDVATGTTLTDSSGNGRHGTISGATWVAGRVGQALNFTGSGVADLGDLDLPGSFTVMAWMQTRSLYAGTCGSLVMKALDYGWELCGGQLMARLGSGGAWSATVSQPLTSADLNTWKHVAMTYDGTTLRFYAGGVLIGSAAGAHTTTNAPLLFGRWTPASEYWNGLIDEVRIYSRVLSQGEIQTDMGGSGTAPNLPPTVSLTTPVGGATFTAPATIAIAATAADSDGTVVKVDFYAGATLVGTDTTSPYAYTWSGAGAGSYAIKAIATDNSGAATTSALANITVSGNVAPSVSLTSPAQGASFVALASVTFAATATDPDGTIQKVEFYLGSILVATDTSSPYSTTWPAVVGSHSVSAVATDNLGARTVSAWRDFTVTATALPSTAIFKPASPANAVNYYVLEIFAAGADPNVAAPIATKNIGLPPVVAGECSADVRATVVALASGNYIATVAAMTSEGKLRSNTFAFTR